MIILKTSHEIDLMKESGKISARALKFAGEAVEPGVTTEEIDEVVRKYLDSQGATSSSLGYNGFPKNCCISVNNQVIHGIPNRKQIIKNGDIVSIDICSKFKGYHTDNAYTFPCGDISENAKRLLDSTKESLYEGIKAAKVGARIGDIGCAIEGYVKARGYSVIRDFVGHGVGAQLHEDPSVPNYGRAGHGPRLVQGMTLAIEPMVNEGSKDVSILDDGWTVLTADGKLSAHFEHTIAVTSEGPVIITNPD